MNFDLYADLWRAIGQRELPAAGMMTWQVVLWGVNTGTYWAELQEGFGGRWCVRLQGRLPWKCQFEYFVPQLRSRGQHSCQELHLSFGAHNWTYSLLYWLKAITFFLGTSRPSWHCFSPVPRQSCVEFFPIYPPSISDSLSYSECHGTQITNVLKVP